MYLVLRPVVEYWIMTVLLERFCTNWRFFRFLDTGKHMFSKEMIQG